MKITSEQIKKHIPHIKDSDANDLASKLNIIATGHKIDIDEIISLLDKRPPELEKEQKKLEEKRQRLKLNIRQQILGE